jgi:putative hydrolase of the HAD superfamily
MSTGQRIVLFDLFGVIALHQRPGALAEMAASCHAPADAFTEAYWALRPAYDAARQSAPQYWTAVLRRLSRPVDTGTIEKLRLADIDSWSRVDDDMVAYVQSLRSRAQVAVLSNIPADHARAFRAAQPWLENLDYVAFSGMINVAKPEPSAFRRCVTAMHAAPADFLFVDDREENVRAAQAVGMTGHVFTGLGKLVKAVNIWLPASTASPRLPQRRTGPRPSCPQGNPCSTRSDAHIADRGSHSRAVVTGGYASG